MTLWPPQIDKLRHIPAASVTDAAVQLVVDHLRQDPRVSHVTYSGRDQQGRAMLDIDARDGVPGRVCGTYSVGRVLNDLHATYIGFRTRSSSAISIQIPAPERNISAAPKRRRASKLEVWLG